MKKKLVRMLIGFGVVDWAPHVKPQIIESMDLKDARQAFLDIVHIVWKKMTSILWKLIF